MPVQPYLFFQGRCEEALTFYRKALGAEVQMLMRYKENPEPMPEGCMPPNSSEKVMHACFHVCDTAIMASDGMCSGTPSFQGFSLSITVPDEATCDRMFNALAEGGKVMMPLGKTFYAIRFGMVTDRFGVGWMVIVPAPMPGQP
jgi:PhnB protein